MELGNLIVTAISAISSLVVAYKAMRDIKASKIRAAENRMQNPLKRGGKRLDNVIDGCILTVMLNELESSLNNLIATLQNRDLNRSQKRREVLIAEKQICEILRQIRNFNLGQLPTQRLNKMWAAHRCEV